VLGNEAWLINAHISQYSHGNRENHPPIRNRKLLLHRARSTSCWARPGKGSGSHSHQMYLKKGKIKCELALAKGKSCTTSARPTGRGRRKTRRARRCGGGVGFVCEP